MMKEVMTMKLIERHFYMKQLKRVQGTPEIKVITGIRRCGKSKLLEAFAQYVSRSDALANVIHVNFNLLEFEELRDYHALYHYVESHYREGRNNYIFIDEVQMCPSFEKAINSFHASEKYDIYITGSNAFLLSSDLATLFTGRTYEIEVYPFSFTEFLQYYNYTNPYEALKIYITAGGMAGSYLYADAEDKYRYIADEVFNALLVRDIITKHHIRNKVLLERVSDYLMDILGSLVSVRKIAAALASHHNKASDKTIGSYIDYLCKAYAFYKIRRYDIRGKRYLNTEDKYYLADPSFKYARLGTKNPDFGHVLENIVAIELLRRGYEVYVGMLYQKEIDFVAIKQNEKLYIQVSDLITEDKTFEREVTPLLAIRDAYPKLLLARTQLPSYQYEGIQIIDIADWLLQS